MAEASGIGIYLCNLLERLTAGGPGWLLLGDPEVLARHPWSARAGVEVVAHRAPFYGLRQQRLPAAARARAPDLLWVPHYNIPLAWRRGQLLVTVHDLAHLALPEVFGRGPKRLYARVTFATVRRRADGILFDSRFSREEFQRLVGTPRGAGRVVYPGVEPDWFEGQKETPAAAAAERRPYFVFVGNVKPHKNLGRLLEAFARVAGEIPHDLVVAGRREGFLTADPEAAREAEALGERVRFAGFVPAAELRRLVAAADALVLPSLYEGFGLPALEAMACGRPVLAARAGALPEVCGEVALYCDPHDAGDIAAALRRIAGDAELRAVLSRRGPEQARRFSWDVAADAVREVIEGLLA